MSPWGSGLLAALLLAVAGALESPSPLGHGSLRPADADRFADKPPPSKVDCKRKCAWKCEKSECDGSCSPVCDAPKCATTCGKPDLKHCRQVCQDPHCAVVCPEKCVPGVKCPSCKTVCGQPVCHLECGHHAAKCTSSCNEPVCTFQCTKPSECPQPECKVTCEEVDPSCFKTEIDFEDMDDAASASDAGSAGAAAAPSGLWGWFGWMFGESVHAALPHLKKRRNSSASIGELMASGSPVVGWKGLAQVPSDHVDRLTVPMPNLSPVLVPDDMPPCPACINKTTSPADVSGGPSAGVNISNVTAAAVTAVAAATNASAAAAASAAASAAEKASGLAEQSQGFLAAAFR